MVVRRAREQSMTVLGDIAQRTAGAAAASWEAVLAGAGVERFELAELLVSYRVPDDFLRLAAHGRAGRRGVGARGRARGAVARDRRAHGAGGVGAVCAALAARMAADAGSVGVVVPAALRAELEDALGRRRLHRGGGRRGRPVGRRRPARPARDQGPRVRRGDRRRAGRGARGAPGRRAGRPLHRAHALDARARGRARRRAPGGPGRGAGAAARGRGRARRRRGRRGGGGTA